LFISSDANFKASPFSPIESFLFLLSFSSPESAPVGNDGDCGLKCSKCEGKVGSRGLIPVGEYISVLINSSF